MLEPCGDPRLPLEPAGEPLVLREELLDCDRAAQAAVARGADPPHPAAREYPIDRVVRAFHRGEPAEVVDRT